MITSAIGKNAYRKIDRHFCVIGALSISYLHAPPPWPSPPRMMLPHLLLPAHTYRTRLMRRLASGPGSCVGRGGGLVQKGAGPGPPCRSVALKHLNMSVLAQLTGPFLGSPDNIRVYRLKVRC